MSKSNISRDYILPKEVKIDRLPNYAYLNAIPSQKFPFRVLAILDPSQCYNQGIKKYILVTQYWSP